MAITQRYSTNDAVQYNESLSDYLINDSTSGKKFLTNAPLNRLIRANELSALYFLIDDAGFAGSTILKFKDDNGDLIYEDYVTLTSTYDIHNGIAIGFEGVPYYVPSNTAKICAVISSNANVFNNPDFAEGSGNSFTSWTLTQPSRTNLLLRSSEFDNAYWTKVASGTGSVPVVTANDAPNPIDGAMTADKIVFNSGAGVTAGDLSEIYAPNNIIANGNPCAESLYLKGAIGGEQLIIFGLDGVPRLITLTTEWQRVRTAYTSVGSFYEIAVRQGVLGTINSLVTCWIYGGQIEPSSSNTPYIPTTSATVTTSLGEFLQDATGGPDGSRAMKLWADTGGITYASQSRTLATTNYIFRAWAKLIDTGVNNPKIGLVINGVDVGRSAVLTTTYQWIEIPFAATVGTQVEAIFYENDENYGFAIIDKVSIRKVAETDITEERCFILDDKCVETETGVQWINKLGGVDTWTFCGNPIDTKSVSRNTLIENPMEGNFEAPNEIFSYRDITSTKQRSLFHRCENEETAVWLRDELIDSIALFVKVGDDFYPIIPTMAVIETKNYAQRNYSVRLDFRFAFNVNIQQR